MLRAMAFFIFFPASTRAWIITANFLELAAGSWLLGIRLGGLLIARQFEYVHEHDCIEVVPEILVKPACFVAIFHKRIALAVRAEADGFL